MQTLFALPAMPLFAIVYLVLIFKMVAVGWYTSFLRIRDRTYATPEDYRQLGLAPRVDVHEGVERARRAHRNDLENILPFFGVGFLYALTNPSMAAARVYLIGYGVARLLHSVCYLMSLQPYRTLAFGVAQLLMLGMIGSTLFALL